MRTIPVLLLCCILTGAGAQLNQGRHIMGIQSNLLTNDWYNTRTIFNTGTQGEFGVSLIPTYGYAIRNNWLIGAEATVGIERQDNSFHIAGKSRMTNYFDFGLAPYTRYYLDVTRNGRLKIFGRAAAEVIYNHTTYYNDYVIPINSHLTEEKIRVVGALGGGVAWFGKRTSFDVSMGNSALKVGVYHSLGH